MTIKCRLYILQFFKLFPKSAFQQEYLYAGSVEDML